MKRIMLGVTAVVLSACGGQDDSEKRQPTGPTLGALRTEPVEVAADISQPYDASDYPKSFAKWGATAMRGEIQQLREDAAKTVALRPECDSVMFSELSDRTSPPEPPEVFVDCTNGNRWRFALGDGLETRGPYQYSVYG